jgi:hypothetical protein
MFDPEAFVVSGISLMALVFGLTQFIKEAAGWEGKKVTFLAASLGVLIMVAYQLIAILPPVYAQVLNIVFTSITFGLSASGYYKFVAERLPKRESEDA